jgi:predicted DNA-binding transcriptional regulator AlpA
MMENENGFVKMPELWDQKKLANYLGKSVKWCERARWAGEGPKFIKLGRHVRYRAEDVLEWIEECAENTAQDGGKNK